MRNHLFRRLLFTSFPETSNISSTTPASSHPLAFTVRRNAVSSPFAKDEVDTGKPIISHGLNWALAGKGVVVKDKAFRNLESSELQQKGAIIIESLSGLPLYVRGNALGGASEISKAQFSKLFKQVTTHISSISDIFVHDGAIGTSPKCDAKVRVISDSPSAVFSLSKLLFKTSARAISHDSCPLTVYVATSISARAVDTIGLGALSNSGFIAADVERSSLILCGKAFSDIIGMRDALTALCGPIISARGGLPLSARLLVSGDSVVLIFAPEDSIQSFSDLLVSADVGVILSSHDVAPLFQTGISGGTNRYKLPAAIVLATSDSSGVIPSISKLSPGQAAYHFLAGCQNGKFVPAYIKGPSPFDPVDLSQALFSKLKDNQIPSFLINLNEGEKTATSKDIVKLVQSTLSQNIPPFKPKGGYLQAQYKSFLSTQFQQLPKEFSF